MNPLNIFFSVIKIVSWHKGCNYKMWENSEKHLQIACFVQTSVQNPKIFGLLSYKKEQKQQILALEKYEPQNFWHFCLKQNDSNE